MAYDLLVRNALIVDGTGKPAYPGGVAVEGGVIQALGKVSGRARRTIDAHGQVLAPGFIDAHTHMDLFLKKYPAGQPVVNHGVTTVVIGDCGASCAPVPSEGKPRDALVAYLRRVLDKYADASLFEWSTFPEYLGYLEGRVGINVAALMPHSPVRLVVMKEAAMERAARPEEVQAMVELVEEGWRAGAIGFSSSPRGGPALHSDTPSTFADRTEMVALAEAVAGRGGMVQYNGIGRVLEPESDVHFLSTTLPAPVVLNEWAQPMGDPAVGRRLGEAMEGLQQAGRRVYGVVIPYRHILRFGAASFYPLKGLPEWDELPKEPAALARQLADPDVRSRLHAAAHAYPPAQRWDDILIQRLGDAADQAWVDKSVAEAARMAEEEPLDFSLDLLARNASTARFVLFGGRNADLEILGEMIQSPAALIGTDAGAHLEFFFWHGAPVKLISYWSRERGLLSLEEAVHKLTGFPAQVLGLQRGVLAAGRPADLLLFDPATLSDPVSQRLPDYLDDAEVERQPTGMHLVAVNGQVVVEDGVLTDARPGRVRRWEL
jgi:N-acyl-D-aspartate/D-glutamate deacylase